MAVEPMYTTTVDELRVSVYPDNQTLGEAAAEAAETALREAVAERATGSVILATGNSQLSFLHAFREKNVTWPALNVFHMDEYLNLPPGHRASFPAFLRRNLLDHVPVTYFFPVPGRAVDVELACRAYEDLLRAQPADLCCLGIGENGHLAFNDPPGEGRNRAESADFVDPRWVKVVALDERSRRQQVGEGHFSSLDEVPTRAITLTIPALRSARTMLCLVPEQRKAAAVRLALTGPIAESCPASILRRTPHARLLLDRESAADMGWPVS